MIVLIDLTHGSVNHRYSTTKWLLVHHKSMLFVERTVGVRVIIHLITVPIPFNICTRTGSVLVYFRQKVPGV